MSKQTLKMFVAILEEIARSLQKGKIDETIEFVQNLINSLTD